MGNVCRQDGSLMSVFLTRRSQLANFPTPKPLNPPQARYVRSPVSRSPSSFALYVIFYSDNPCQSRHSWRTSFEFLSLMRPLPKASRRCCSVCIGKTADVWNNDWRKKSHFCLHGGKSRRLWIPVCGATMSLRSFGKCHAFAPIICCNPISPPTPQPYCPVSPTSCCKAERGATDGVLYDSQMKQRLGGLRRLFSAFDFKANYKFLQYQYRVSAQILELSALLILVKYILIPQHQYQLYTFIYVNFVKWNLQQSPCSTKTCWAMFNKFVQVILQHAMAFLCTWYW